MILLVHDSKLINLSGTPHMHTPEDMAIAIMLSYTELAFPTESPGSKIDIRLPTASPQKPPGNTESACFQLEAIYS